MESPKEKKIKTSLEFSKDFEKNPPNGMKKEDVKGQVEAISKFSEGRMSYSQMRSICG